MQPHARAPARPASAATATGGGVCSSLQTCIGVSPPAEELPIIIDIIADVPPRIRSLSKHQVKHQVTEQDPAASWACHRCVGQHLQLNPYPPTLENGACDTISHQPAAPVTPSPRRQHAAPQPIGLSAHGPLPWRNHAEHGGHLQCQHLHPG